MNREQETDWNNGMEMAPMDDMYMTDEPEKTRMEQDWAYMKQLYPNSARRIGRYVDDALDRLEYEDSMMFDEYPDQVAVEQLVRQIIAAIQENEPMLLDERAFTEEIPDQSMNNQVMPEQPPRQPGEGTPGGNQTWSRCVEVLIQVMVLADMHHRRWRYDQQQRRNY